MAFTIASNVAGAASTGRPCQGHVQYAANQGAWWAFFLTSTQSLSAAYSTAPASAWTAPAGSPMSLAGAHGSEGRDFGLGYASIASTDVLHLIARYASASGDYYHSRYTLGTTWTRTNTEDYTGAFGSFTGAGSSAISGGLAFDGVSNGSFYLASYSGTDSGTSWTTVTPGFTQVNSSTGCGSSAIIPLGSGDILAVGGNGAGSGQFTNLVARKDAGGTTANVFGTAVTQADDNAWGAIARTATDVHAVALSNNSNAYVHARWNGSSWSAGDTIPVMAYGTDSGISVISDGTSVWAAAIDGSGNVYCTKWTSGGGWGGWTQQEASNGNTRAYITGAYDGTGHILWAWTEYTGSQYNVCGTLYATTGGGTTTQLYFGDLGLGYGGSLLLPLAADAPAADSATIATPLRADASSGLEAASWSASLSIADAGLGPESWLGIPIGGDAVAPGSTSIVLGLSGDGAVVASAPLASWIGGDAGSVVETSFATATGTTQAYAGDGGNGSEASSLAMLAADAAAAGESAWWSASILIADAASIADGIILAPMGGDAGTAPEASYSSSFVATQAYAGDGGSGSEAAALAILGGDAGSTGSTSFATASLIAADLGSPASSSSAALLGGDAGAGPSAAFATVVVITSPLGVTDPAAARLVMVSAARPTLAVSDPDAAALVLIVAASPTSAVSDPDSATIVPAET